MSIRHIQKQSGVTLVVSLIILVALTILGVTSMQSTRTEISMAGNLRESGMAFNAAEAGLSNAERFTADSGSKNAFADPTSGLYAEDDDDPDYHDDATWGTDLSYATVYRVVVRYDQVTDIAQLWVDPTMPSSDSIYGVDDADPGVTIERFMLRQASSSMVETVRVDNLVVATACEDSFEDCAVAVEAQAWGAVKSLYR